MNEWLMSMVDYLALNRICSMVFAQLPILSVGTQKWNNGKIPSDRMFFRREGVKCC